MTRPQNSTGASSLTGFHWEPDTRTEVIRQFAEIVTTNKQEPWKDKAMGWQYTFRASYNPVQKAFRTAALRRNAPHPMS